MQIEAIEIAALNPSATNSRTHSKEQILQIAASIKEFNFTNPVLIDDSNGIIAGHGRVMAAREIGLDSVPCIRLSHLTEIQRRAYIIADNKLALNAGWDDELLKMEFEALDELGFDLELTGFSLNEIEMHTVGIEAQPSSAKEINPDEYVMGCRCPKCGFEFDDKNA